MKTLLILTTPLLLSWTYAWDHRPPFTATPPKYISEMVDPETRHEWACLKWRVPVWEACREKADD